MKSERIVLIDWLRGVSILLVMAAHLDNFVRTPTTLIGIREAPWWAPIWHGLATNGALGVCMFFVLSGYLISGILIQPGEGFTVMSYREFYVRRAGRILPLLALICLVGATLGLAFPSPGVRHAACFAAPFGKAGFWLSIATFWFNLYRFIHDHAPHALGLHWGVLWSLSVEEQFYAGYPLLLRALGTVRRVSIALCGIIAAGFAWRLGCHLLHPGNYLVSIIVSFGAFDQLAIGCLIYLIQRYALRQRAFTRREALLALWGGCALGIAIYLYGDLSRSADRVFVPTILAASVGLIILGGSRHPLPNRGWLHALCLPGELSYGMYLLHTTVLFIGWTVFTSWTPWPAFALYVAGNIALGYAVYNGYERPLNVWIRRRFTNS